MNLLLGKFMAWLIRGYQKFISPLMPPSCRFYPTCSEYSRVSFTRHGLLRGLWLTVTRILRCNPWNPGGWDPVPPLQGQSEDRAEVYGNSRHKPKKGSTIK